MFVLAFFLAEELSTEIRLSRRDRHGFVTLTTNSSKEMLVLPLLSWKLHKNFFELESFLICLLARKRRWRSDS